MMLKVLSLDHNLLWDYPVWSLTSLPSLSSLSLGHNSWPCDCLTVRNIQRITNLVTDGSVACTTESGEEFFRNIFIENVGGVTGGDRGMHRTRKGIKW